MSAEKLPIWQSYEPEPKRVVKSQSHADRGQAATSQASRTADRASERKDHAAAAKMYEKAEAHARKAVKHFERAGDTKQAESARWLADHIKGEGAARRAKIGAATAPGEKASKLAAFRDKDKPEHQLQQGAKGGAYYLSESGQKVYVKK